MVSSCALNWSGVRGVSNRRVGSMDQMCDIYAACGHSCVKCALLHPLSSSHDQHCVTQRTFDCPLIRQDHQCAKANMSVLVVMFVYIHDHGSDL